MIDGDGDARDLEPFTLSAAARAARARAALGVPRPLHPVGRQEAGRAHPARSSAGRATKSRACRRSTPTRRSSASCRACATTSSTSSAATRRTDAPAPPSTSATAGWTASDALALVDEHEGKRPASLDVFLEYVGITEDEFHEIALSHEVVAVGSDRRRRCSKGERTTTSTGGSVTADAREEAEDPARWRRNRRRRSRPADAAVARRRLRRGQPPLGAPRARDGRRRRRRSRGTPPSCGPRADRIVLPGVGAFGECMANLRASGFLETLEEEVLETGEADARRVRRDAGAGDASEEMGDHEGLGWIPGRVRPIRGRRAPRAARGLERGARSRRAAIPSSRGCRGRRLLLRPLVPADRFGPSRHRLATCARTAAPSPPRCSGATSRPPSSTPRKARTTAWRMLKNFLPLEPSDVVLKRRLIPKLQMLQQPHRIDGGGWSSSRRRRFDGVGPRSAIPCPTRIYQAQAGRRTDLPRHRSGEPRP